MRDQPDPALSLCFSGVRMGQRFSAAWINSASTTASLKWGGLNHRHIDERLSGKIRGNSCRGAPSQEPNDRIPIGRRIPSNMPKLTDKEIRQTLIAHLGRRASAPRAILEEVHVCNGNAIADVVTVYKAMHCYEIKGETDSINRVVRQSQFYDQAFPLISLVTTTNHLKRAEIIVPKHWGILLANPSSSGSVFFRYVRGASRNTSYRPEIALLSLWRSELIEFPSASSASLKKMNREKIAALITSSTPTSVINESVGRTLAARNSLNTILGNLVPCK
jgi:hypothetical protein